jgi:hypothetical protein
MDEIHEPRTPYRSAPAFLARRHAAVASQPLLLSPDASSAALDSLDARPASRTTSDARIMTRLACRYGDVISSG